MVVASRRVNVVTSVVPEDKVLDEALALGGRLAALPAQAVRATKIAMNMHLSRSALGVLEYALQRSTFRSPGPNSRTGSLRLAIHKCAVPNPVEELPRWRDWSATLLPTSRMRVTA